MSRAKRIVSEQEKQEIIDLYKSGFSINNLRNKTRLQKSKLKIILLEGGVQVLTSKDFKIRAALLEDKEYFSSLNELNSYVLGLIFGDGCVFYDPKKYKYSVTLTSNDLDILESGRCLFGTQFNIKKRKTSNAYNLVINSKQLCLELINKFYLQSPKSDNLIWPELPNKLYPLFISGLLSTDGCVRIDNRRKNSLSGLEFSYSSNCLDFILKLQNHLINELNISKTIIKKIIKNRKNINYCLRYSGFQAKLILDYIYNKTTNQTRCDRKYQIYLTCVSNSII